MSSDTQYIAVQRIQSLNWRGDALVDWVGGGKVLRLDGVVEHAGVHYAFRFDAAVVSPCGDYAVIYEKLGTKGLILFRGKIVREINRSFYHAHVYEYPVALFRGYSGRILLAHCPAEYCQLELEDVETGERITTSAKRAPSDFFHSRLRVSPDGRWLLSAGWVWHPWDALAVYDLDAALRDPTKLDQSIALPEIHGEMSAAEFLPNSRILLTTTGETLDGEEEASGGIRPNAIAVFNPATGELISSATVEEPVGTLMAVDDEVAVGFYEHPKLISLKTGAVLKRWDEIKSGDQTSSIIWNGVSVPPIAIDQSHRRFAVADEAGIFVVSV